MQQVLAEIRQAGALDPASQQKLIEDLQQADPTLWPLMVQQFRAQIAYRHRLQEGQSKESNAPATVTTATDKGSPPAGSAAQASATTQANPGGAPGDSSDPTVPLKIRLAADRGTPVADAARLPELRDPRGRPTDVVPASYQSQPEDGWQKHLAEAIRQCEAEISAAGKSASDPTAQAQLRMLYLLAGRRDDALRPMASVPPAQQEFWLAELYGLSAWLDAARTPDDARRAAEAKKHLDAATIHLGESCPLVVKNLAFCQEIQSFGCIKPFERCEFSPGQAVLLYAEVENLTGETTERGVHTSLQSSYQIFDGRSQRVADEEFTVTEEYCRNPRRDYFIGYELHMPERIYPGKHVLQLTIRDAKSQKIGQATIDFTIKKK